MINWIYCSGIRENDKYDFVNGKICNRKLLLFDLKYGWCEFEIKCPRCSAINEFSFRQEIEATPVWKDAGGYVVGFDGNGFVTSLTDNSVRLTGVWNNG